MQGAFIIFVAFRSIINFFVRLGAFSPFLLGALDSSFLYLPPICAR